MFLGGAGLADTILYCRHKIYPLGLPNWAAHGLTFMLGLVSVIVGRSSRLLPAKWAPIKVTVTKSGEMQGRFAFLMVTTLERLLLNGSVAGPGPRAGAMQLLVIERSLPAISSRSSPAIARPARPRPDARRSFRSAATRSASRATSRTSSSTVRRSKPAWAARSCSGSTAPVPFLRLAA